MNRGVEIDAAVADHPNTVIVDQVRNGVAVRMAVLFLLLIPAVFLLISVGSVDMIKIDGEFSDWHTAVIHEDVAGDTADGSTSGRASGTGPDPL
jgi:hypothetical protein